MLTLAVTAVRMGIGKQKTKTLDGHDPTVTRMNFANAANEKVAHLVQTMNWTGDLISLNYIGLSSLKLGRNIIY